LIWNTAALQLLTGGKTNIEATPVWLWIGQKDPQSFHVAELERTIGIEGLSHLLRHGCLNLIESTTDGWTKGHNQLFRLRSSRC
jgi:hypothetical protein